MFPAGASLLVGGLDLDTAGCEAELSGPGAGAHLLIGRSGTQWIPN